MPERIYSNTKAKPWRKGRTHFPHRTEIVKTEYGPYGKIITKETAVFKTDEHQIPNGENGAWETTFSYGHLKIRHSKTADRFYLFYGEEYLREVSPTEQYEIAKRLLQSVNGFREETFTQKGGTKYRRFVLKAETYWRRESKAGEYG